MTRNTDPTKKVRETVLARDLYMCARCLHEVQLQVHHRRPRGMGGTRRPDSNQPQNLLTLCAACHRWVETNRASALMLGLLLKQTDDPTTVPVMTWRGRVYLDHDGSFRAATVQKF